MALAWATSPSPVNLRFGSRTTTSATPLVKKQRSSVSVHRLVGRGRALAEAAPAATCDEQRRQQTEDMLLRLDEDGWVEEHMLSLLTPVAEAWQPADLLPTFAATADEHRSQVSELQARAAGVPDELLVCLVGNMVTEEALPTGRVDMPQVERTVHHLIARGMRMSDPSCAYRGFVYGAFQERATFVSHARTARLAARHGDACLARICGAVAADERRHEAAYTRAVARCIEGEPDAVVRALAAVMRDKVTMPGELMTDGRDGDLFAHFSAVAQRAGVYTAADYGDMVEHFVRRWGVAELVGGLSSEGRRAQDYVCGLPRKIRRMEELAHNRAARMEARSVSFSWLFDRPVLLH
ncbi:unnamed protein product [Urochloa decumbens]